MEVNRALVHSNAVVYFGLDAIAVLEHINGEINQSINQSINQ
jgi:hypothetical protein